MDINRQSPMAICEAVKLALRAQQPFMVWGSPGIGKSDIVRQAAHAEGLAVRDIRAVNLDPVDVRGLPIIDGRQTVSTRPDLLPADDDGERGVLFFDELPAAAPAVRCGLYQLILDRAIGDHQLPAGWTTGAAGNLRTDRALSGRMGTAEANRFMHLYMSCDLDSWVTWALQAGIRTEVIAFLRFRPEFLHDFDPARDCEAFASPRSWAMLSRMMATDPAPELELPIYSGLVGSGPAVEMTAFLRIWRDLQRHSVDAIIVDPDHADIPSELSVLVAICGALARKASPGNIDAIARYVARVPEEFAALTMLDAIRREPSIAHSRGYIDWAARNSQLFT